MALRNLTSKKKKIVERFRNRNTLPVFVDKKEQDVFIIDTTLKCLYNEGDKVPRSFYAEILKNSRIRIPENEAERVWDILVNTGLVNPVIGFGNSGKLTLTNEGYQLMNQFGSYSAFLQERQKQQAQPGPNIVFPQFIIEPEEGENKNEEPSVGKSDKK